MSRLKPRERRSGCVKDLSRSAREAIELTTAALGGVDRLVAWATKNNKNETVFWTKIFVRLLELEQMPNDVAAVLPEDVRKKLAQALDTSNDTGGTSH